MNQKRREPTTRDPESDDINPRIPPDLDKERMLLMDAIYKHGLTLARMSTEVGRNKTYLNQYIMRRSPRILPAYIRQLLAERLGFEPDDLIPIGLELAALTGNSRTKTKEHQIGTPFQTILQRKGARDLPVYLVGTPKAGLIRRSEPDTFTLRPDRLRDSHGAFAGRMVDDGLAPWINIRDTLYFDPVDPVTVDDIAVVIHAGLICVGLVVSLDYERVEISDVRGEKHAFTRGDSELLREVGILRR